MDAQDIANVLGEIKEDGAFIRFSEGRVVENALLVEVGNKKETRRFTVNLHSKTLVMGMFPQLLLEVKVLNA